MKNKFFKEKPKIMLTVEVYREVKWILQCCNLDFEDELIDCGKGSTVDSQLRKENNFRVTGFYCSSTLSNDKFVSYGILIKV